MARPVALMLNGYSTHATNLGGLLTILVYVAVGAWYYWQTKLSFNTPPTINTNLKPLPANSAISNSSFPGFYDGSFCISATVIGSYVSGDSSI
jgi:hypothetical protein